MERGSEREKSNTIAHHIMNVCVRVRFCLWGNAELPQELTSQVLPLKTTSIYFISLKNLRNPLHSNELTKNPEEKKPSKLYINLYEK